MARGMRHERLITRDAALILVGTFFYMSSTQLLGPVVIGFTESLGASVALAGLISGLLSICSLLCRPIAGNITDRVPKQLLATCGSGMMLVGCVGYVLAPVPAVVGVCRVVNGIGYSLCSVCMSTWFAEILPQDRVGAAMGIFGMMNALGVAIGPSLGIMLYQALGYRAAMAAAAVLAGCSLIAVRCVRDTGGAALPAGDGVAATRAATASGADCAATAGDACGGTADEGDGKTVAPAGRIAAGPGLRLLSMRALPAAIMIVLFSIPYFAAQSYLVSYAADRALDVPVEWFFTIYAVVLLALRVVLRDAFDRVPFRVFACVSAVSLVLAMVLLGIMRGPVLMVAAAVCVAGSYGVMCSVCQATAVKLAGAGHTGLGNSTYYMGFDIGMFLGPALGGVLYASVDIAWFFPLLALAAPCALALLAATPRLREV